MCSLMPQEAPHQEYQEPPASGVPAGKCGIMGRMGSSLGALAPGAHEKAKTGARPTANVRQERPSGGRSCSPEAEEGRVGRRVPPPSPGAGPGHPALCAPGYTTTPCRCWHLAGNIGERHSTLSMHTPRPPALTPLSLFPLPASVCLYVRHWVRRARPRWGPSGGRRISAARARGSRTEKIMNEMHAVLPLPRPPCPGNLRAGAARAGTPSRVGGEGAPERRVRDEGSAIRPHSGPGRCRSSRAPPASPAGPAQFPGSGARPPGGGAEPGPGVPSRPGGCARDSAAQAHLVERPGEGARTERGTERRADGPTDGRTPPHTQTHRARRGPRHTQTHTHTRADTHRNTRRHTHTRARTSSRQPARPPARRRPEPALAGKCGASVGAFVWGAGRWKARGPSRGGPATETAANPQGREAGARHRHAPMGLPAPPDWGRGPCAEEGARRRVPGREQQPLPTKLVHGSGEGWRRRSRVRASATEAGARLLAASPLRGLKLRREAGDRR